jgi:hypothetical protein
MMKLGSPLALALCLGIISVSWTCALCERSQTSIAGAAVITVLCIAALQLGPVRRAGPDDDPHRPPPVDESAQFRRGVFELCAALKLGILFCEQHLHSEPDALLQELERMNENITSFVNATVRPVRMFSQRRWPWQAHGSEDAGE